MSAVSPKEIEEAMKKVNKNDEFNHTCRKCKYLKLTYAKPNKEWTCEKRNKNKAFEDTIFNYLCRDFEPKN